MLIKTNLLSVTGALVLLFICFTSGNAQGDTMPVHVQLMFYNVENLFDTYDDTSTNDNEFLPGGVRRWNHFRYDKKIDAIYKTITAAGEWSPPAVVAFCEVENRHVLEDLIYGTYLSRYNYGIIHEESPDERGIDACLIFRKDLVKIIDTKSWIPAKVTREGFRTRNVLYAKCSILGDTVHIIVNHWPSRRGGVLAGETVRTDIGRMVRDAADSLGRANSGHTKIIILGDFNCTPDDNVIQDLLNPGPENGETRAVKLINLADNLQLKGSGTYKYSGTWELIDQIIVSEWLLKCHEGLTADIPGFRIFKPDFLLKDDPKFPGLSPFSTYRGYRYQGGFSDHLPVLLDLVFR